jgi:hypothetical protein
MTHLDVIISITERSTSGRTEGLLPLECAGPLKEIKNGSIGSNLAKSYHQY